MKKPTVVLALLLLGLPVPALAYVRTRTSAGVPTAWKKPTITMEFALGGPPAELDAESYLVAAQQGTASWTQASLDGTNRCSKVMMGVVATADVAGLIGNDGHNRIIFRQNEWCRDPAPSDPNEPRCYDSSALAITTVSQLRNSGEIVDADIEVNAVGFTWGDFVGRPDLMSYHSHDFQGAITHELGHVLGLEHTCYIPSWYSDGTPVPRPVDNKGNPIPNCEADNPPLITDATMYVSVSSPETEIGLRTLSLDDMQGVCDIYSVSSGGGGGCSLSRQQGGGTIAFALALAALAILRRRHR
jgi:hypothetical protein